MTHLIDIPGENSEERERIAYFIYEILGSNPNKVGPEIDTDPATIRNIIGPRLKKGKNSYRGNKPSLEVMGRFIKRYPNLNPMWWYKGEGDVLISTDLTPESEPPLEYDNREVDDEVVNNIRAIRKAAGLTQKEFAESVGSTLNKINSIEMRRVNPTIKLVKNIRKRYKVTYYQILDDVNSTSMESGIRQAEVIKLEDEVSRLNELNEALKSENGLLKELNAILKGKGN